jgi:hypothetical protein
VALEVQRFDWNADRRTNERGSLDTIQHLVDDADDVV